MKALSVVKSSNWPKKDLALKKDAQSVTGFGGHFDCMVCPRMIMADGSLSDNLFKWFVKEVDGRLLPNCSFRETEQVCRFFWS